MEECLRTMEERAERGSAEEGERMWVVTVSPREHTIISVKVSKAATKTDWPRKRKFNRKVLVCVQIKKIY